MTISTASLEYIINHVVLPPKLPTEAEPSNTAEEAEQYLFRLLLTSVQDYRQHVAQDQRASWDTIEKMLHRWNTLNAATTLPTELFVNFLSGLSQQDVLPTLIRAQNAALFITRIEDGAVFETFELSPRPGDVMQCVGNLRRSFPAHAVFLPTSTLHNASFRQELAQLLKKLDFETIEEMLPTISKAGATVAEVRDTAHPGLVTEMLMATIAAMGRPIKVPQIHKRTRDDVLWTNCLLPWRRSSLWLATKVAIQLVLIRKQPSDQASLSFKNFMVAFMANLMAQAVDSQLPRELCHVTQAKISRRSFKLGATILDSVQAKATSVGLRFEDEEKRRWQQVQVREAAMHTPINVSTLELDTALTLHSCKPYLDSVLQHDATNLRASSNFSAHCPYLITFGPHGIPKTSGFQLSDDDLIFALKAFEIWVRDDLSDSIMTHRLGNNESHCTDLAAVAMEYKHKAYAVYTEAPEQMSMMLLTIAELWRALDIMALKLVPLLSHFPPELPEKLFRPLLLPKREDMARLMAVEQYIASRVENAKSSNRSVFSDPLDSGKNGFTSQFYEASDHHQALRKQIEVDANQRKSRKSVQWAEKKALYDSIMTRACLLSCRTRTDEYGAEVHDKRKCEKCQLETEAKAMRIDILEWPLPDNEAQCRAAIIEMRCPKAFVAWRNLTWMFIQDLGRAPVAPGQGPADNVFTYKGLRTYGMDEDSRLILASKVKSFTQAHYRTVKFPTTFENLSRNNGLQYCYYDKSRKNWTTALLKAPSLSRHCVQTLPEGPYSKLQWAVNSTEHTQNQIIADQVCGSKDLSLHEIIAFGSLRADGERTQWANIKRELGASNLTFNNEAVFNLVTQAAWQSGSEDGSIWRRTHGDFRSTLFCRELLSTVDNMVTSVEANWNSDTALILLVVIALRTLSLTNEELVIEQALHVLHRCRYVGMTWMQGLGQTLGQATDGKQVLTIQTRLLRVAILVKLTYDVDKRFEERVMSTADDVQCWVSASMTMHDNTPVSVLSLDARLRWLLIRTKGMSCTLRARVSDLVVKQGNRGLDEALQQVWSHYRPSATFWFPLREPNDRWLQKETAAEDCRTRQTITYNLLEGTLLVDGFPLGRLPREFSHNELYLRIYGSQIFEVFSSNMLGMQYMSAHAIQGHQVHFGKRDGQVVIRVQKGCQILEAVPHHKFRGDLPCIFVDKYVQWLDLSSGIIYFRPLGQADVSSSSEWQLRYQPGSRSYFVQGDQKLVDVRSKTAKSVSKVLDSLEMPSYMHITSTRLYTLEVALPRFAYNFFLSHQKRLECRELRKLVDLDQSIGTFIGLKSKLVLCAKGAYASRLDRIVLVPEGQFNVSRNTDHPQVTISSGHETVRCFRYRVDPLLGRLQGDGSTTSGLYQAYIHALTSCTQPDPLTGRTGTEQAHLILQSLVNQSFKPIDQEVKTLLDLISGLTPRRVFYPVHLKVMQNVAWIPWLSFFSQHDDFAELCTKIVSLGDHFNIFYPVTAATLSLASRGDAHLLRRARLRHSVVRSPQCGGNIHTTARDKDYMSRDALKWSDRASRTFQIASLIAEWPSKVQVTRRLAANLEDWGTVSGFGTSFDTSRPLAELLTVSLNSSWAPLWRLCSTSSEDQGKLRILFAFATIAYGIDVTSLDDLRTLLAFAFDHRLRNIRLPTKYSSFTLSNGDSPRESSLRQIIRSSEKPLQLSSPKLSATQRQQEQAAHQSSVATQVNAALRCYLEKWPCRKPKAPPEGTAELLDLGHTRAEIKSLFAEWWKNRNMQISLTKIQEVLDDVHEESRTPSIPPQWLEVEAIPKSYHVCLFPTLDAQFLVQVPKVGEMPSVLHARREIHAPPRNQRLQTVLGTLDRDIAGKHADSIRHQYKTDLQVSLDAYGHFEEPSESAELPYDVETTALSFEQTKDCLHNSHDRIRKSLGSSPQFSTLLRIGGYEMRTTLLDLFGRLSFSARHTISDSWLQHLIVLGRIATLCQRARRLLLASERGDAPTFHNEIENTGSEGWDAKAWPDWLLIEIDSDFLIRPMQARVALEMVKPSSASNMLTQLNMGEGKSSVIVPLVAAALADGEQLSRVLVLRSLTRQMMDTLTQRLGGLVNRRIYYMPFSRKTPVSEQVVSRIRSLLEECLVDHGVCLAQPEFLLSFRLMGIERLTAGHNTLAQRFFDTQRWLDDHARDLLDESDEILDVKFQLIYTIGSQRNMDGQPDRWILTQSIFDLVDMHATFLANAYPGKFEIERRSKTSFPTVRFLAAESGHLLISRVADDIGRGKLPGLNFEQLKKEDLRSVLRFCQIPEVDTAHCKRVIELCRTDGTLMNRLLLIRGLIVHKVLLFILQSKRWSVNYGHHPSRCLCAVPYRAKGVPAATAEFGHPDVMIGLTCLSYYYSGLSDAQLRQCFYHLYRTDDPSYEYAKWTKECNTLPSTLRNWTSVNLDDDHQCSKVLFPALRYCKKVSDFYMASVVFPKEGKEFDKKISTSGWDIPSKSAAVRLTTGFSGTNDNRFLLPYSITQQDIPELRHTSGKVLDYVLRPENLRYECASDINGRQLGADGLLDFVAQIDPRARVLIDVGAQVLETCNEDIMRDWIRRMPDVDAGIFFNTDDKIMVLTRDRFSLEPLASSSFQDRMDRCLVYLDEVHTRGTDLKLPRDARAIVTLGPRLTKDRLVQACMRLRQLAHGQSLLFIAPPEVHRDIMKITGKSEFDALDGYDVISWALSQSCLHIERSEPLRIMQGLSYHQRQLSAETYFAKEKVGGMLEHTTIEEFVEKEKQSLHDLYAPSFMRDKSASRLLEANSRSRDPSVQALIHRWNEIDPETAEGANVHEEYEREIAHEVEQEKEIQRPRRAEASKRIVDPRLEEFVRTGDLKTLRRFDNAYNSVVQYTSAGEACSPYSGAWDRIRVSQGFVSTVVPPHSSSDSEYLNEYLRPVNWILTSKVTQAPSEALVISQYEANQLMDNMHHAAAHVTLHIYEPRVTRSMPSMESATIPESPSTQEWIALDASLRRQLHLFAGQLYFDSYEDYCGFRDSLPSDVGHLRVLKKWMGIRRRGQNYLESHIGQIVSGQVLQEEAFER